jgi:hypothetical protein
MPFGIPNPFDQQTGNESTDDGSQPINTAGGAAPKVAIASKTVADPEQQKQTLSYLISKHGPVVGAPAPVLIKDIVGNPLPSPTGAKTYTFQDNTTAEVDDSGGLGKVVEGKSQTAPSTKTSVVTNPDGSETTTTLEWDPTKGWTPSTTIPVTTKPSTTKVPADPSKWIPIHSNPQDPSSPVIALQDPDNASNRVAVPQTTPKAHADIPPTATTPGYIWDDAKGGYVQAPGLPTPQGKPTEGQTRTTVDAQGRTVSQTYSGGDWVNSSISGLPKEGDTRQSIDAQGHPVTQTYSGGSWINTSIGGLPKEGDTRNVVDNGYHVTQKYQGGAWTTTDVGAKAIPDKPTQIQAPADQATLGFMDSSGKLTTQINPNYAPVSQADVARQVGALQQAALQQRDQISQNLQSGVYGSGTDAQAKASQAFSSWWAQNVEPQKASLQAAQQQAQVAAQQKAEEQQRLNLQTAQSAGTQAIQAAQAQLPYTVGPGFGAALNNIQQAYASGKAPGNIDLGSAVTFQMPDINQLAQQATNQALAHISQSAASGMNTATGPNTPNYNPSLGLLPNVDVNQALNAQTYQPGSMAAPPPVQAAPPQQQQGVGTPLNFGNTLQQGTGPLPPYAPQQPGTYGVLTGAMPSMLPAYVPGG